MPFNPTEIKPKKYPTELLDKDWSSRVCFTDGNRDGMQEILDQIHDFKVREDDVWIVTLPKCGTTWMQELCWVVANDCDFDGAKEILLDVRSPCVEMTLSMEGIEKGLTRLENLESPRIFKTHLPLPLLPAGLWKIKPKTIYVTRDPKDALVSLYHFRKVIGHYSNTSISEALLKELDFEAKYNNWFNHVLEFYELRNESWIYYTSFEKMKTNLEQVILDVVKFLNKSITPDQMNKLLKHLSFEEMKNNPKVNHVEQIAKLRALRNIPSPPQNDQFIRKGKVGSSKEELPEEVLEKMETWISHSLKPHNLSLKEILLYDE